MLTTTRSVCPAAARSMRSIAGAYLDAAGVDEKSTADLDEMVHDLLEFRKYRELAATEPNDRVRIYVAARHHLFQSSAKAAPRPEPGPERCSRLVMQ